MLKTDARLLKDERKDILNAMKLDPSVWDSEPALQARLNVLETKLVRLRDRRFSESQDPRTPFKIRGEALQQVGAIDGFLDMIGPQGAASSQPAPRVDRPQFALTPQQSKAIESLPTITRDLANQAYEAINSGASTDAVEKRFKDQTGQTLPVSQ